MKKHDGGQSIKFWGCLSTFGLGNIVKIERNMNGLQYSKILSDNLNESIQRMEIEKEFPSDEIKIFQDHDPKHDSRIAREFFSYYDYKLIEEYPPSSPDLNPKEDLWAIINKQVASRMPSNREELWQILEEE